MYLVFSATEPLPFGSFEDEPTLEDEVAAAQRQPAGPEDLSKSDAHRLRPFDSYG